MRINYFAIRLLFVDMLCRRIGITKKWQIGFFRYKSHYLSDKWLKEPFTIEYPNISSENEKLRQDLLHKLFPHQTPTPQELYLQDKNRTNEIQEWDTIDFEERNKYEKLATSLSPRYIHPKPLPLKGYELFKSQVQLKTLHYAKKQWLKLSDEDRTSYTDSKNISFINNERERIWKGYEIVEYLKRYQSQYAWNPYNLLTLYPWEIIKDKLRSRMKVDEFERDYYDALIREAFYRNYQRKAMHIYYTDLQYFEPKKYTYQQVLNRFKRLSNIEKQYYHYKQSLREKHALRTKAPMRDPGFRYFATKFESASVNPEDIVSDIVRAWDVLTITEREKYANMPHRLEKELFLDWKVSIVMDYIYYTGQVSGVNLQYNWRKDMKEKTRGFTYLRGMYTENII